MNFGSVMKQAEGAVAGLEIPDSIKGMIPDSAMTQVKDLFSKYDKDGSGALGQEEVESVMKDAGTDPAADKDMKDKITELVKSAGGKVKLDDFVKNFAPQLTSLFGK